MALATCLSVLLGLIIHVCLRNGSCPLFLVLRVLLGVWLLSLMSGMMGARFRIQSLVLHRQDRGFLLTILVNFWVHRRWGHLDDDVGGDRAIRSCRGHCSVPGPLQTVQRAEFWGVILALQAAGNIHLGVDNLSVVRHVGRLLDGNVGSCPAELVKDGDLVLLLGSILEMRGRDTVRISEVKGHADEGMVREGGVRELDRLGNIAADEAADFGRRRVCFAVIDARRNFAGVCGRWYPVILVLHRFFVAISRAVVSHVDGAGTALDPLVWSAGAHPKRRRLVRAVRDRAFLPGPPDIWDGEWIALAAAPITADDVYRSFGVWYCVIWLPEQFGVALGRHCGIGVYGVSSVCHSGPSPFFFAVQPCGPDLSQNCPNVDFSSQESNGG